MGEAKKRKASGDYPDQTAPKAKFDRAKARRAIDVASLGGRVTTPAIPVSDRVRGLIDSIVPGGEPVLLPFVRLDARDAARYCQLNTSRRVKEHGGKRVDGWMLWENNLMAEAEAHSVWQDDAGMLVDITPRLDHEAEILFLPDPSARTLRLKVNGRDVDRLLVNRTTLPDAPYVTEGGKLVLDKPYQDYEYPPGGRKQMMQMWGIDTAASLES